MINALIQVSLQLLFDTFFGVFDNGEMGYRDGASFDDLLTYLSVTAYISTACTVCTGNVLRFELAEFLNGSRKVLHSFIGFRREQLKGQKLFFFHHFR